MTDRYLRPGLLTRRVMNPLVKALTWGGASVKGSRVLAVRGRTSGEWRTVPVNPLEIDGTRYLVAPRGTTEWVRNIRVAGGGELRLGRRSEPIRVTEVGDGAKPSVLREYIRRWKAEVGAFFDGVDEHASNADLLGVAAGVPVFVVEPAPAIMAG